MIHLLLAVSMLMPLLAAAAGIGEWVGYDRIESTLERRLFADRPACEPPRSIFDEYRRLYEREAILSNAEGARYVLLQQELSLRSGFPLGGVLGDFQPHLTGFSKLLGSRFQPAMEGFFMESSHAVNALGTLGWDLTLSTLARRLGETCRQVGQGQAELSVRLTDPTLTIESCRSRELHLRAELASLLVPLCQPGLPADPSERRALLAELFRLVAGLAVPPAEEAAWLDFADTLSPAPPAERVETLFRTIFLNPYFLLRH